MPARSHSRDRRRTKRRTAARNRRLQHTAPRPNDDE